VKTEAKVAGGGRHEACMVAWGKEAFGGRCMVGALRV